MGFGLPCWVWFTHARRLARPAPPPPTRCPVLGLAHLRAGRVRSDPGLEAPPTTTTHRGARDDAWRLRLRRHKETEEGHRDGESCCDSSKRDELELLLLGYGGGERGRENTVWTKGVFLSFSCEHHVGNDIVISVCVCFFLGVAAWVRVRTCNY